MKLALAIVLAGSAIAGADPIDAALDVSRVEKKPLVIVVDDSRCTTGMVGVPFGDVL